MDEIVDLVENSWSGWIFKMNEIVEIVEIVEMVVASKHILTQTSC